MMTYSNANGYLNVILGSIERISIPVHDNISQMEDKIHSLSIACGNISLRSQKADIQAVLATSRE